MVTANRNLILSRCRTGDANGHGIRLSSGTGQPHHVGPRVKLHEFLSQINFLGAIQGGHVARSNGLHDCLVNFGMSIPEDIGSYAHDGHVDVFLPIEIPDLTPLCLAEIGRPLIRQEHFRPF